jgi:hypothetical protein
MGTPEQRNPLPPEEAAMLDTHPQLTAALRFGLGLDGLGFHIYVAAPPGLGKMTAVQAFLQGAAARKAPPPIGAPSTTLRIPTSPRHCGCRPARGGSCRPT